MARIGTRNIVEAKHFYSAVAEALGAKMAIDRKGVFGFRGPEGALLLIGTPLEGEASAGNGSQFSLIAPSRAAVDTAHTTALSLGAACLGEPGPRGAPESGLYAAYFRDADGNKVMLYHTSQS